MKLLQLILAIPLIGLLGCQSPGNKITITGKILGDIPEKVEYTSPINGTCNWWFTESVQPDSLGNFLINVESNETLFIKLRTSYKEKGTLIVEPGKTYDVVFDLKQEEGVFSVTDESSIFQEAYNKLPEPSHIQQGAREFMNDSVATEMKEKVDQKRTSEIAKFEKFLTDKVINEEVFKLVKTDRNCYYDAVLATAIWIKKIMTMQGRGNVFNDEFEQLWKDVFEQPLFSNTKTINSQWFNFYAESYIHFKEYINGNLTKEKLDKLHQTKQIKNYHIAKAQEYLPPEICEDYIGNYLYKESLKKKYEKELVNLFAEFETNYPESGYSQYISPLVEEITRFHQTAGSEFNEKIHFIKNYQNLNSLKEVANTFSEGKIYVDVWASWCGPCKAEFEYNEELKTLLQKNDIQLLYISIDRDRDSVQWKNMIKYYNLEGYHVRANSELVTELRELFDKDGSIQIPWYMLMDNKGSIIKKRASRPSQTKELEKEING